MSYLEDGNGNVNTDKAFVCSHDKKNVLLIGDSIREGYCSYVKESLADIASVFYPNENCKSTHYVAYSLYRWAEDWFDAPERVDLVHFNCGHWDIAHWCGCEQSLTSEEEYGRNIAMIFTLIKKYFVNAKIVFATTTPMNPNGTMGRNVRTTDEIIRYNSIAVKVSKEAGIPINDLYGFTCNWDSSYYKDYCHYTEKASKELGYEVARRLREILS